MILESYLENIKSEFKSLKEMADKAIAQVTEEQFSFALDEESNSIALIMKHLAGNMRSRWTGFLTSDGEKPDRNRDGEFKVETIDSRENLLKKWEAGWELLFQTLDSFKPEDLDRAVSIRGKPFKVYAALHRQMTHYAAHI